MANVRIIKFDNFQVLHPNMSGIRPSASLQIFGQVIPGSLSMQSVAMMLSASGTTAKTVTLSLGLYSLNGSTLSLANSASFSSAPSGNIRNWINFAVSNTSYDITPGNWYLGVLSSTSGNNNMSLIGLSGGNAISNGTYAGALVRGALTATTNALPASVATSDFNKDGGSANAQILNQPYMLIAG